MENVITYAKKYCNETAKERLLSLEDSIVLCSISYLVFENILKNNESTPLKMLTNHLEELRDNAVLGKYAKSLLLELIDSKRYKDVSIENFINVFDHDSGTQFEAMTFRFDSSNLFVIYRGTDATFTGWKEDFLMAIQGHVHGQDLAKDYLTNTIQKNPTSKIWIGGHSKGGNLCAYALLNIDNCYLNNVMMCYDLDGPGFKNNVFETKSFQERKEKLVKVVPQEDVIGQLLITNPNYLVIKSSLKRVAQHALYAWHFKDGEAEIIDNLSHFALKFNKEVNSFIKETPIKNLKLFVEEVFDAFDYVGIDKFTDFNEHSLLKIMTIIDNIKHLNNKDKGVLKDLASGLFKIYIKSIF